MQLWFQKIKENTSLNTSIISALLTILAFSAPLSADDYLDSLEAEADTTTVLKKAQKEHEKLKKITASAPKQPAKAAAPTKKNKSKNTQTTTISAAELDAKTVQKFEDGLYREFPGNYAVYTGLANDDKMKVVAAYQQASNKKGLVRYGPSLTLILHIASQ